MFIIADIMRNCSVESQFIENIPRQTRFRSVPDVVVLNSQLLAKLLIKCQRFTRVWLRYIFHKLLLFWLF